MLNSIWAGMILLSIFCALCTGNTQELSQAVFSGAETALQVTWTIAGSMAVWTGLLKIAENAGITKRITKLLRPIVKKLLPEYKNDSEIMESACANITANLLGLGNAATPMGIETMKAMKRHSHLEKHASNDMIRFVVLNTASLQIFPTMLISLRAASGSAAPAEILPATWLTSACVLFIGLSATWIIEKRHG